MCVLPPLENAFEAGAGLEFVEEVEGGVEEVLMGQAKSMKKDQAPILMHLFLGKSRISPHSQVIQNEGIRYRCCSCAGCDKSNWEFLCKRDRF